MIVSNQVIQQGMHQGMQQGRQEGLFTVAKNMLDLHLGLDVVQQATGLSRQEIASLAR